MKAPGALRERGLREPVSHCRRIFGGAGSSPPGIFGSGLGLLILKLAPRAELQISIEVIIRISNHEIGADDLAAGVLVVFIILIQQSSRPAEASR